MFKSLYSKIAAGLALLFFIVGLIFIGITVFSPNMYQQEVNQKLNTNLARQIVKERLLMKEGKVDQEALKEIFHMLMVINPGIEIYLLDTRGKILTDSAPPGSVKREFVDLDLVKKYLSQKLTRPFQGDDPKSLTRRKVFSAAPIERQGNLEGYLYVILGGEQYDSVVQKLKGSYILQLSAWMIFAGLLFALIAGLLLFALLTGRLKKLTRVVDAFKRGDSVEPFDFPVHSNINSLVNELLELAKLESPEMKTKPEPFNLQELAQDVVQKFMLRAKEKQIRLETQIDAPLPFAVADIALEERVFENLIENALHYTPENGIVRIQILCDDDLIVQIRDTGQGIAKEEIPHIFERFYHSDKGRKGKDAHSGLGLAITNQIIKLHQRQIIVTSEDGKGSCFSFNLPCQL